MYPLQEQRPTIAVLDVGGMDDDVEQQPKGVCQNMTLAPFNLGATPSLSPLPAS